MLATRTEPKDVSFIVQINDEKLAKLKADEERTFMGVT